MTTSPDTTRETGLMLPVSVVVPVLDGADFAPACLDALVANRPGEILLVDGGSTDDTLAIAARYPEVRVLRSEGGSVAAARMTGVRAATHPTVALVDVDVVVPDGALQRWYDEYLGSGLTGLQAGLAPESLTPGYWGESLAEHQRLSRARHWFTLCATMLDRDALLGLALDADFGSGEDIEFRHRLRRAGLEARVSDRVAVRHRFRDGYAEARHQWDDDGAGLAATVRKNGWRDLPVLGIPAAGFVRGVALTWRRPSMLRYWTGYLVFNYAAMLRTLVPSAGLAGNSGALLAARALPMVMGFLTWAIAGRWFPAADVGLAASAFTAATLSSHVSAAGPGNAVVLLIGRHPRGLVRRACTAVVGCAVVAWLVLLAAGHDSKLAPLTHGAGALAVGVLVVGICTAYFLDHVAIARRRSADALRRSVVQSALMLAATVGLGLLSPWKGWQVLTVAGSVGALASVALGIRQARGIEQEGRPPSWGQLATLGLPNLALTAVQRGPMLVLPFVVVQVLSPAANAAWYVAWMMALAIWFVPNSVAWSLQARLTDTDDAAGEISRAIRTALGATAVAAVAVAVVGPLVLHVLGPHYEAARPALWVLCVAALPSVAAEIWLVTSRVRRRTALPLAAFAVVGVTVVVLATVVAGGGSVRSGLTGIALVWLAGQVLLGAAATIALRARVRHG